MTPRWTGSRRPHSRQYSWSGSYGVPQRGHSPPSSTGAVVGRVVPREARAGRPLSPPGIARPAPPLARPAGTSSARRPCSVAASARAGHGGPAVRAELCVSRNCVAAVGAGDDGLFADRASAVARRSASPTGSERRRCSGARRPRAAGDGDLESSSISRNRSSTAITSGHCSISRSCLNWSRRNISSINPPRSRMRSSRVRTRARRSRLSEPGGGTRWARRSGGTALGSSLRGPLAEPVEQGDSCHRRRESI